MATVNCSNIVPKQALKGQGVFVTLSGAESLSVMPLISAGNLCTVSGSNKTGTIVRVDTYGHGFLVAPIDQITRFDSNGTPGLLNSSIVVTVTY